MKLRSVLIVTTDDRLYQMSHSEKIVSAIFYEHALAAILAVSVIHAMKREHAITHFGSKRNFCSKCRTRHLA